MNDDDGLHGAASDLASTPPGPDRIPTLLKRADTLCRRASFHAWG
jgi:hypothetical protein